MGQPSQQYRQRVQGRAFFSPSATVSRSAESESRTQTTVMAGSDTPLIRQTVFGQYRGALIVCQGADAPSVRLKLVNAVAGLTGLPSDKITVIKMKH